MNRPPVAAVLGAAWGLALIARPDDVLRVTGSDLDLPYLRPAVRVLGARHLLQAAILTARPGRLTTRAAAAVEGTHALSMLALAVLAPGYRGAALASAGSASALAIAGLRGPVP